MAFHIRKIGKNKCLRKCSKKFINILKKMKQCFMKKQEKIRNLEEKSEKQRKNMPKKEAKKTVQEKEPRTRVAKGVTLPRGKMEEIREKPGSGSAGKYKGISPSKFVGAAGKASKFSFPVDTLARARNALARAHFAPDPEGIKKAVYRKWPELKRRAKARGEKV
jgi:hypothetical protein